MSQSPMEKQSDKPSVNNEKSVDEIASDGLRGVDEPMEKEHPESPALLVFATYPILLIVGLLVVGLWWWLSSR